MSTQEILIIIFLVAMPIGLMLLLLLRPAIWWYTGRRQQLNNQETIISLLQDKTNKKEVEK